MARRRKQDAADLIFIFLFVVVAVIIVVASICVPFVLVVGYLYFRSKRKKQYSQLRGSLSDFWLRSNEKTAFKQLSTTLNKSQQAVDAANQRGAQAGLERNLDGRFSARSRLGKEIRRIEEHNDATFAQYLGDYEYFRDLPKSRWSDFRETYACEKAMFLGLWGWVVSATLLIGGRYLAGSTNNINPNDGSMSLYVAAVICALVSMGVFFIRRFIAGEAAQRITPMPSEVTLDNVNKY